MIKEKIGVLLVDTFNDARKGAVWKWLVGSFAPFLTILLFAKNLLGQSLGMSMLLGGGFLLFFLILRFLYFLFKNYRKAINQSELRSRYGFALCKVRDTLSKLNSLKRDGVIEDNQFMENMTMLCNSVKELFDNVTKKTCSVSIKVPTKGSIDEKTVVNNLCRDSVATKKRDNDIYRQTAHTIIGNTPYLKILNSILKGKKEEVHYINNNIQESDDYENTSRDAYEDGIFPYKSELVYPIKPYFNTNKSNNFDCIGFICIDCETKHNFDEKYDVAIISIIADGLYDTIKMRNLQRENPNDESN